MFRIIVLSGSLLINGMFLWGQDNNPVNGANGVKESSSSVKTWTWSDWTRYDNPDYYKIPAEQKVATVFGYMTSIVLLYGHYLEQPIGLETKEITENGGKMPALFLNDIQFYPRLKNPNSPQPTEAEKEAFLLKLGEREKILKKIKKKFIKWRKEYGKSQAFSMAFEELQKEPSIFKIEIAPGLILFKWKGEDDQPERMIKVDEFLAGSFIYPEPVIKTEAEGLEELETVKKGCDKILRQYIMVMYNYESTLYLGKEVIVKIREIMKNNSLTAEQKKTMLSQLTNSEGALLILANFKKLNP